MKTIKKLSIVLLMSMAVMPVFAEETNEFKVAVEKFNHFEDIQGIANLPKEDFDKMFTGDADKQFIKVRRGYLENNVKLLGEIGNLLLDQESIENKIKKLDPIKDEEKILELNEQYALKQEAINSLEDKQAELDSLGLDSSTSLLTRFKGGVDSCIIQPVKSNYNAISDHVSAKWNEEGYKGKSLVVAEGVGAAAVAAGLGYGAYKLYNSYFGGNASSENTASSDQSAKSSAKADTVDENAAAKKAILNDIAIAEAARVKSTQAPGFSGNSVAYDAACVTIAKLRTQLATL